MRKACEAITDTTIDVVIEKRKFIPCLYVHSISQLRYGCALAAASSSLVLTAAYVLSSLFASAFITN